MALLDPKEQTFVIEGADGGLSFLLRGRPRSYWNQEEWKKWLAENKTPIK